MWPLSSEWLAEHWPALFIVICVVFGWLLYKKNKNSGKGK